MTKLFKISFLFLIVLPFSFLYPQNTHAEVYNKEAKKTYYQSANFKNDIKKFCNFQTNISASYKKEVSSVEEAKFLISKLGDLPRKGSWSKEIDSQKSYLVYPGDQTTGIVYHFVYRHPEFLFGASAGTGISDYYRERFTSDNFKGCVVYTSSPLKAATFEYKIIQEDSKVFVQRISKVIPEINVPVFVAKKKLEQTNKETLEKVIKDISKILLTQKN